MSNLAKLLDLKPELLRASFAKLGAKEVSDVHVSNLLGCESHNTERISRPIGNLKTIVHELENIEAHAKRYIQALDQAHAETFNVLTSSLSGARTTPNDRRFNFDAPSGGPFQYEDWGRFLTDPMKIQAAALLGRQILIAQNAEEPYRLKPVRGRRENHFEDWVGWLIARAYFDTTGKAPKVATLDGKAHGPFYELVKDVLQILGFETGNLGNEPEALARKAVKIWTRRHKEFIAKSK